VEALIVESATERTDDLSLDKFPTDGAPRTIESAIIVNAVVHIVFAVEATGRKRSLTFCR